jgi:hypothetical protein
VCLSLLWCTPFSLLLPQETLSIRLARLQILQREHAKHRRPSTSAPISIPLFVPPPTPPEGELEEDLDDPNANVRLACT